MNFFVNLQFVVNNWWPWLSLWNDVCVVQFLIICTFFYVFFYKNIYYILLYTFLNFFLIGVYLSIFQIELFTAFLWLVECSVLFVFLLLLFFLNIKANYSNTYQNSATILFLFFIVFFILLCVNYSDFDCNNYLYVSLYCILDNYYESLYNPIVNDLFGFSISYYVINVFEFVIIGMLLLFGSVVCVNLYQMNKNIRAQSYTSFLTVFNFFADFTSFHFLRKQSLVKQGNTKPSLKVFKKK